MNNGFIAVFHIVHTEFNMPRSLALILLLLLSSCGLLPKSADPEEQKNWSASKFYSEAKAELNDGNFAAAIKLFESLEARYPYGRYAQQTQLEVAYAHYKDNEKASAIAAEGALALMILIHSQFTYKPLATHVGTRAPEALALKLDAEAALAMHAVQEPQKA